MKSPGQIVWQALRQARWLPLAEPSSQATLFADVARGDDLLPLIAKAWSRVDADQTESPDSAPSAARRRGSDGQRGVRLAAWAEQHLAAGGRLTLGPAPADHDGFRHWNGDRLVWWPQGVPTGTRIGLVSSHLGRQVNDCQDWFRILRAACAKMDRQREVLVTAATTTTHEFACRAAELFDLRLLLLMPPGRRQDCRGWLDQLARQTWPVTQGYVAHVSPALEDAPASVSLGSEASSPADRMLIALPERLLVFHLRRRGRLLPLVQRRLADPIWRPQSVVVALGRQLVAPPLADELMAAGAVGWVVLNALEATTSRPSPAEISDEVALPISGPSEFPAGIVGIPPADDWHYLTHCTRQAGGPWPDQARGDYLDELILSSERSDHSALATLRRILRQRRILATSPAIRGGAEVVSFTAVPLAELPGLRTFRVHRGRWDFEPYGICIQRAHLRRLGARPVVYGDENDWEQMSDVDRPYFQRQASARGASGNSIDWTQEREWRVLGDVALDAVATESALVFVPTMAAARALLDICRWPIVVLEDRRDVPPE